MNVEYTVRDIYGTQKRYPANRDGRLVCDLARTTTITDWMAGAITSYGGTMTEVHKKWEVTA